MLGDLDKELQLLVMKAAFDAVQRALRGDANMELGKRDVWTAFFNARNALLELRTIAETQALGQTLTEGQKPKILDFVKILDQVLQKIDPFEKELNPYPNKPNRSLLFRQARAQIKGEIASALAELYNTEKQKIGMAKWLFVAYCMTHLLPEHYQTDPQSDRCQAWKDIVRHHKSCD